jgi:hypothetical protein
MSTDSLPSATYAMPQSRWKAALFGLLRVAPWVMFGPITGFMSERALRCWRREEHILAGLYVVANISTLIAIPTLTAVLAARL